jgi:hypothetical protein
MPTEARTRWMMCSRLLKCIVGEGPRLAIAMLVVALLFIAGVFERLYFRGASAHVHRLDGLIWNIVLSRGYIRGLPG